MSRNVTAKDRKLAFVYAAYKAKERAEAALEDMFAAGEVSECELAGDWIERHSNRYCILLKA